MPCSTPPQALALYLGVVLLLVVVGEYRTSATQPATQQPFNISATQPAAQQLLSYDFPISELALSLVVNQMTLLRMLNESSVTSSMCERDLEELFKLKLELNTTSEEVIQELHEVKSSAISECNATREEVKEEIQAFKHTSMNEMDEKNQEGKQHLQQVKEELEAALRTLHEKMETVFVEIKAWQEESKQVLVTVKEEALNEVNASIQDSKQDLLNVQEQVNASIQESKQDLLNVQEQVNAGIQESKQDLLNVQEQSLNAVNTATEQSTQELLGVKNQTINVVTRTGEQLKEKLHNATEAALKSLGKGQRRKTYTVFPERVTQPEAVAACKDLGGHLALPLNEEENEEIHQLVWNDETIEHKFYWIGTDDKQKEGLWTNSATGQRLCYTKFDSADGQPDNYKDEDCVDVRKNKRWNDADCTAYKFIYVCEFTNCE